MGSTAWSTAEGVLSLDVDLPDGVPAPVRMPGGDQRTVTGGRHGFVAGRRGI